MKRLLARLRDWWNAPLMMGVVSNGKRLMELNSQIDFLKYQVSGLMSDEEWRKVLSARSRTPDFNKVTNDP